MISFPYLGDVRGSAAGSGVAPEAVEEFVEVEPGYWQDVWGVIWDRRDLRGTGDNDWGRPVNCMLPRPTLKWYRFPQPPGWADFAAVPSQLERHRGLFTEVARDQ